MARTPRPDGFHHKTVKMLNQIRMELYRGNQYILDIRKKPSKKVSKDHRPCLIYSFYIINTKDIFDSTLIFRHDGQFGFTDADPFYLGILNGYISFCRDRGISR
jgi:hypothetical protein